MNEIRLRDGRRLAYEEHGAPHGTPIVHCHGAPGSRIEGEFLFEARLLVELGIRLIVPDRPGIGRSDFQARRSDLMFRLAKYTPPLLGLLFRLNLRMTRSIDASGAERMIARFPEPDRTAGSHSTFYPDDAHLSVPLNRAREILPALLAGR